MIRGTARVPIPQIAGSIFYNISRNLYSALNITGRRSHAVY